MRSSFLFLIAAFLLASCSSSIPYTNDYPLTQQRVVFRDGLIAGLIPQGWFASDDDSLASLVEAWLVTEDLSATLGVRELKLDRLSSERVKGEGMQLLASLTIAMNDDLTLKNSEVHDFEIQGRRYAAYESTSKEGKQQRVVVFSAKGKYYECRVLTSPIATADQLSRLFNAQQTFVSTLRY